MYMVETKKPKKLTKKQIQKNQVEFGYSLGFFIVYSIVFLFIGGMTMVSIKEYTTKLHCYNVLRHHKITLPYSKNDKSVFISFLELSKLKPFFDMFGLTAFLNTFGLFEFKDDQDVFFFYRKYNSLFGALFSNWYSDIFIRTWSGIRFILYTIMSYLSLFFVEEVKDKNNFSYQMKRNLSYFTSQSLTELVLIFLSPIILFTFLIIIPLLGKIGLFISGFISNFIQMLFLWWTIPIIAPFNSMTLLLYFSFMFLIYPIYKFGSDIFKQIQFLFSKYILLYIILFGSFMIYKGSELQINPILYLSISIGMILLGFLFQLVRSI